MRALYVKYSTLRKREYRICTQIVERDGARFVRKVPAVPEALAHVEAMAHNARRMRERTVGLTVPPCTVEGGAFETPYVEGAALDCLITEAAKTGGAGGVCRILDDYRELVRAQPRVETDPGACPGFARWFGESVGRADCLALGMVDLVTENIVRTLEGKFAAIDYEWLCDCPVPVDYVFHRAVRLLYLHHRDVLEPVMAPGEMLARLGVSPASSAAFEAWDIRMDERIQGDPRLLPVPPQYLRDKSRPSGGAGRLYYDTGEGYSENRSIDAGGPSYRFELPPGTRVRGLRFDPCEGACCAAVIREAWAETDGGRVGLRCVGGNAALKEGDAYVFATRDPQLLFNAPASAVFAVCIAADVRRPEADELERALKAQQEGPKSLEAGHSRTLPAPEKRNREHGGALLRPAERIEALGHGRYRATGPDPQFYIGRGYEPGILRVDWAGEADFVLPLRLYYDTGEGFTDNGFFIVGALGAEAKRGHCYVTLEKRASQLRLDPGEGTGHFKLTAFSVTRPAVRRLRRDAIRAYAEMQGVPLNKARKAYSKDPHAALRALTDLGCPEVYDPDRAYIKWMRSVEGEAALADAEAPVRISVVVPVYETGEAMLREMIGSVRAQSHGNWQLCIADGGSRSPHVRRVLEEAGRSDARVRVAFLPENRGIAGNSNAALALAEGEYVALLDHDDVLAPFALSEAARAIAGHDPDMLYSDEDKLTADGKRRFMPHFKPDWDAELLRSCNYVAHLLVARRALVEAVGGFREGFEGSQDHDLILRLSEKANKIVHIPKVLYHWRSHAKSTALHAGAKDYAAEARRRAVGEHCARAGVPARVETDGRYGILRVRYEIRHRPFVSVVIIGGEDGDLTRLSAEAAARAAGWDDYEIVVLSRRTEGGLPDGDGRARFVECAGRGRKAVLYAGAEAAKGNVLVLMEAGVAPVSEGWIGALYELGQREDAGAVGCLLRYPNGALLHAGVVPGFIGESGYVGDRRPADDPGYMARVLCARETAAVSAACVMVGKRTLLYALRETEGDDPGDVALFAAVRRSGRRVYYTPHAQCVWHGVTALPVQGPADAVDDPFYSPHFTRSVEPYRIRER